MKKLWILVDRMRVKSFWKNTVYIAALSGVSMIAGGAVWLLLGRLLFPSVEWLFCFMGYPVVFAGIFGGTLYLYGHEFT